MHKLILKYRRPLRTLAGFLLFLLATYCFVWIESYLRSRRYLGQAVQSLEQGGYAAALKGERRFSADQGGYVFQGGLQQVVETWEHPWALPKPPFYFQAAARIEWLIDSRMSLQEAEGIFQQFFKLDNRYLGRILIRIGDLQEQQNRREQARETYGLAAEIFALDEEVVTLAEARLRQLQDRQ